MFFAKVLWVRHCIGKRRPECECKDIQPRVVLLRKGINVLLAKGAKPVDDSVYAVWMSALCGQKGQNYILFSR